MILGEELKSRTARLNQVSADLRAGRIDRDTAYRLLLKAGFCPAAAFDLVT